MPDRVQGIIIQPLRTFSSLRTGVDILRIDRVHPVVSGNKWFKLRYYLEDAASQGATTLVSFGGAYSNHIVALAYAGKEAGFDTVGFIRGEETARLSPTLLQARSYGMELLFTDRQLYRDKSGLMEQRDREGWYWIPEGGYGSIGAAGAKEILLAADTGPYSDILCAIGTGTMFAGLVKQALPHQRVTGINVLKGYEQEEEVKKLLTDAETKKPFRILHEYHFGGYARHPETLIAFMRWIWEAEQLPTDIVYTSKLLFAVKDLLEKDYFSDGSNVLVIHSGGLQGNRSLPPGTLPFL